MVDKQTGDIKDTLADITKAKKDLEFKPKISFIQGIKKIHDLVQFISQEIMRVGLLNLKVGNINSVHNVLKKIGISVEIIDTETQYKNQDLIILKRVSSFDNQIKQLKDKNFFELLKNENKKSDRYL